MAAEVSLAPDFACVLACYREQLWQYGPLHCFKHELDDIDSLNRFGYSAQSVLAIAVRANRKGVLSQSTLLKAILRDKWLAFGAAE